MLTRVSMSAGHLLICNDGMSEQKCLSKRALALHCACASSWMFGPKKVGLGAAEGSLLGRNMPKQNHTEPLFFCNYDTERIQKWAWPVHYLSSVMSWSGRSGSHRITNQMNAICAGRRSSKQHSWHRHSEVSSFWYLAAFCCLEPMFKIIPRWRPSIPCQNLFLNQGFSNSSNMEDEERVGPGLFI